MPLNHKPNVPAPTDCSARYADGWIYADWFLSKGGNPDADSPDGWAEEKYAGWWDRLAVARRTDAHVPQGQSAQVEAGADKAATLGHETESGQEDGAGHAPG